MKPVNIVSSDTVLQAEQMAAAARMAEKVAATKASAEAAALNAGEPFIFTSHLYPRIYFAIN